MKSMGSLEIGGGIVQPINKNSFRLLIPPKSTGYCDAQVDDYHHLPRNQFRWHPPIRMALNARTSHRNPIGTLGFGFWNDPFTLSLGQGGTSRRLPASPRAVWFFYGSPPNNLTLQSGTAGHGWKAMSLQTTFIPSIILAPLAGVSIAMSFIPILRPWIIRAARRWVASAEQILDLDLTHWHRYELIWLEQRVIFRVDEKEVMSSTVSPKKPLGFVAWIDNQYATISPMEGLRFGVLPTTEGQWLQLGDLQIGVE
jgi:hypothetical protein